MSRLKSILALVLLVPAPSIGVLAAMVAFPGTTLGKVVFAASKAWLFAFPAAWTLAVDRTPLGLSPVRKGGMGAGIAWGLAISTLVVVAYAAWGHALLDHALFVRKMREVGLGSIPLFAGGAAYWILVNSVLEEYVWRWFVYRKCADIMPSGAAVAAAAFCFCLHHFVALRVYCSLSVALIGACGVFAGGVIWSVLYRRYASIWPGYASHAIVDLGLFGIGASILYGCR